MVRLSILQPIPTNILDGAARRHYVTIGGMHSVRITVPLIPVVNPTFFEVVLKTDAGRLTIFMLF